MKPAFSDLALNAFVDGELSLADAARIAAEVADDPTIAQRVAHLHQLKAALSTIPDDLVLPAPSRRKHTAKFNIRCMRALVAGCVIFFAVFWSAPVSGPAQQDIHLPSMAQHDRWASQGVGHDDVVLPARFDWLHAVPHASGLHLVYHTQVGNLQHFGFKGVNACRLSLFVSTNAGSVSPLQLSLTAQVQHAQWHIGTSGFEMIARDMALARFATVATGLHRASQNHTEDEALQVALLRAARLACTA